MARRGFTRFPGASAKYVVTLTAIKEGPDSTSYFLPLGYEVAEPTGEYTIVEGTAAQ